MKQKKQLSSWLFRNYAGNMLFVFPTIPVKQIAQKFFHADIAPYMQDFKTNV